MKNNSKISVKSVGYFALLIGWMGLIFYFSSRPGDVSSLQSSQVQDMISNIAPGIGDVMSKINAQGLGIFHIRKLAHIFLYFMLTIFAYMFTYNRTNNFEKSIKLSMLISVIYASCDEIHQLYVAGRSGMLVDVWVDSIGVFVAIIAISIFKIVKNKC